MPTRSQIVSVSDLTTSHNLQAAALSGDTPIHENFIYKKQGPSPISLVRANRIFSKAKTLKKNVDLSLAIRDIPIYPF